MVVLQKLLLGQHTYVCIWTFGNKSINEIKLTKGIERRQMKRQEC